MAVVLLAAQACGGGNGDDGDKPVEFDCGPFGCTSVPAPVCEGDDLVVSSAPGDCVADGVCIFEETSTACEHGCDAGECLDPCAGVVCDDPQEDVCDGHNRLRYPSEGVCELGECSYEVDDTDCTATGEICVVDDEGDPDCTEPPPSCDDGRRNGDETDIDCGGGECLPCEVEQRCREADDCVAGVCQDRVCAAPGCRDRVLNQDETDVDCGGSTCEPCDSGEICLAPEDCTSVVCGGDGTCRLPTCTDAVQNADETDLDCGGTCPPCAEGLTCIGDSDCTSRFCARSVCTEPTCEDGATNANETGVDCGGTECGPCPSGEPCIVPTDCQSAVCDESTCVSPTCTDGVFNGTETSVDCGGGSCAGCVAGDACVEPRDCLSGVCDDAVCWEATCEDGVRNGSETDVDCGGPACGVCQIDDRCSIPSDCVESVCLRGRCVAPLCTDGVANGTETDIDCGGPDCDPCADGQICADGSDCASTYCDPLSFCRAAPACDDRNRNGDETDIDCGGAICEPCNVGRSCLVHLDCVTMNCRPSGTCGPFARCDDGVQNGAETDADCGGDTCVPCDVGEGCGVDDDCTSAVCIEDVCVESACDDGRLAGLETDIDCGGPECEPCADSLGCVIPADCTSLSCHPIDGFCQAPTCSDGIQNGDESAIDCGGTCGGEPCPTECGEDIPVIDIGAFGPASTPHERGDIIVPTTDSAFEPPAECADPAADAEIVFRVEFEAGTYGISTTGDLTGFDTVLYALDQSCAPAAPVLSCNDDVSVDVTSSEIELVLDTCRVVFVIVDGLPGDGATYSLLIESR